MGVYGISVLAGEVPAVEIKFLLAPFARTQDAAQGKGGGVSGLGAGQHQWPVGLPRFSWTNEERVTCHSSAQLKANSLRCRTSFDLAWSAGSPGFQGAIQKLGGDGRFLTTQVLKRAAVSGMDQEQVPGQRTWPQDQKGTPARREQDPQRGGTGPFILDTTKGAHGGYFSSTASRRRARRRSSQRSRENLNCAVEPLLQRLTQLLHGCFQFRRGFFGQR